MNDLSSDARSLLSRLRVAHDPPLNERERVRKALAVRLAAGATMTASLASAAKVGVTSAPGSIGGLLLAKAVGAGFLVGSVVIGAGVLASGEVRDPPAPSSLEVARAARAKPSATNVRTAPQGAGAGEPASALSPLALESSGAAAMPAGRAEALSRGGVSSAPVKRPAPTVTEEPPVPNGVDTGASGGFAAAAAAFPAPPAASPTASARLEPHAVANDSERLTAEARALALVQRTLDQGSPALALELLNRDQARFTGGALGQERAAARVFALCALGRKVEAQREGARFLAAAPQSPLSARVKAACAE